MRKKNKIFNEFEKYLWSYKIMKIMSSVTETQTHQYKKQYRWNKNHVWRQQKNLLAKVFSTWTPFRYFWLWNQPDIRGMTNTQSLAAYPLTGSEWRGKVWTSWFPDGVGGCVFFPQHLDQSLAAETLWSLASASCTSSLHHPRPHPVWTWAAPNVLLWACEQAPPGDCVIPNFLARSASGAGGSFMWSQSFPGAWGEAWQAGANHKDVTPPSSSTAESGGPRNSIASLGTCGLLGFAEGLALGHPLPSGLHPLRCGQDALCVPTSLQDSGVGLLLFPLQASGFIGLSAQNYLTIKIILMACFQLFLTWYSLLWSPGEMKMQGITIP